MPSSVPGDCTGETYFIVGNTTLCLTSQTFFLCDGATYSNYDCANPGSPWELEVGIPDTVESSTPNASQPTSGASTGSGSS